MASARDAFGGGVLSVRMACNAMEFQSVTKSAFKVSTEKESMAVQKKIGFIFFLTKLVYRWVTWVLPTRACGDKRNLGRICPTCLARPNVALARSARKSPQGQSIGDVCVSGKMFGFAQEHEWRHSASRMSGGCPAQTC